MGIKTPLLKMVSLMVTLLCFFHRVTDITAFSSSFLSVEFLELLFEKIVYRHELHFNSSKQRRLVRPEACVTKRDMMVVKLGQVKADGATDQCISSTWLHHSAGGVRLQRNDMRVVKLRQVETDRAVDRCIMSSWFITPQVA